MGLLLHIVIVVEPVRHKSKRSGRSSPAPWQLASVGDVIFINPGRNVPLPQCEMEVDGDSVEFKNSAPRTRPGAR